MIKLNIAVIGAGSWGTVLAQVLNDNGHDVSLWVRDAQKATTIAHTRINSDYLPNLMLDPSIMVTNDLDFVLKRASVLVFVVPSKAMAALCTRVATMTSCADKIILFCTKGFDLATNSSMSAIIYNSLPNVRALAVLSGPNLAKELSKRQPGATVIASHNLEVATELQKLFLNGYFRPYTSTDVLGVELCGCLKNAIALVSGMMWGLGYGENSQAALITRGLAEITRLGLAMGASAETFYGLAGIGDLIATCTSTLSRNRTAGVALAQGQSLNDILNSSKMVIEGVGSTQAAYYLAKKYKVEMPIITELYQVLYENKTVPAAIAELMQREGKKE